MKNLICGIDPGMTGGISFLTYTGTVVSSIKMPETEQEVTDAFRAYAELTCFALIEKLQPMFKTSKVAMFKLGRSYGTLRGVLIALQIPFDEVRPQKWQTYMGCLTKGNKAVSRQKAQQLWPTTKITNANADSLLIAEYARRNKLHL